MNEKEILDGKELLECLRGWTMDGTVDNWREEDQKAYEQIKEMIAIFHSPLGHIIKYSPEEEWIRIK